MLPPFSGDDKLNEHGTDRQRDDASGQPPQNAKTLADDEFPHDLRIGDHAHHHEHNRYRYHAVNHRCPIQRLDRVDSAACAGMALVNALAGTRNELHLAYAQLNLAAAWLAMDDVAQALGVARAGWPLGLRFELQPYWADYLALIAMLEGRPRTSARLAGYADIGYAGREQDRAHNETAAIERARVLARTALGDAEFERLYVNGGALQDGEIATLAFATEDSVGATVRADFVWVATANRGVARPPSSLRNCLALCALR